MSYRTTCPQCASIFRLGDAQLAAAAGWAQCSVCGAKFDVRPSLRMEDGSPLPSTSDAAPTPSAAAPRSEAPADVPAAPAEPADAAASAPAQAAPEQAPSELAAAETLAGDEDLAQGIVQREHGHELDSIILIDPDAAPPDDPGPLPQIPQPGTGYPPPAAAAPQPPKPTVTRPATTDTANPPLPVSPAATPPAPPRRRAATRAGSRRWVRAAASLVLFAGLLAQSAFFLRDSVVSLLPQTRPVFERVCATLGCTLALPRKLALLQIVGSDLQTEAGGGHRLVLTLGNRADHVQAWPVLVLTLTDQRDRPLSRRSFAPSEYLGDPARIAAGLAPRSEEALSLPLDVSGPAPMGFDLKLAY